MKELAAVQVRILRQTRAGRAINVARGVIQRPHGGEVGVDAAEHRSGARRILDHNRRGRRARVWRGEIAFVAGAVVEENFRAGGGDGQRLAQSSECLGQRGAGVRVVAADRRDVISGIGGVGEIVRAGGGGDELVGGKRG